MPALRASPRSRRSLWLWCALLAGAPAARAHQASVSTSDLRVQGNRITGSLRLSAAEVGTQVHLDATSEGRIAPEEIARHADDILRAVIEPFRVTAKGEACPLSARPVVASDGGDGVLIEAQWTCPAPLDAFEVVAGHVELFPLGHTHLSRIQFPGEEVVARTAVAAAPRFEVKSAARTRPVILVEGFARAFESLASVAFLTGLVLLGGSWRARGRLLASFAVGSSVAIAVAGLDLAPLPARWLAFGLAASVVWVGFDALWSLHRRLATRLDRGFGAAFAFGLMHGAAAGSAFLAQHPPASRLLGGLACFHLGFIAGQACLAGALASGLWALRTKPSVERKARVVLAAVTAGVGLLLLGRGSLGG